MTDLLYSVCFIDDAKVLIHRPLNHPRQNSGLAQTQKAA
jgi:hypothetical protein